jgi:CDGSH-type Zn-finger protein/truncated hemoglobin YjbI/ferredoxin
MVTVQSIALRAAQLAGSLADTQPDVSRRLRASVVRPLDGEAASTAPTDGAPLDEVLLDQVLWQLAEDATMLRAQPDAPTGLLEAAAALQELALAFAGDQAPDRLAALVALEAGLPATIEPSPHGPYLLTNVTRLTNYLGEPIAVRPQMALCRCGGSAAKPWCDGSHAEIGFSGDKDPSRVPDHRDAYTGQQVAIFDNRGACAHSGFCTDRLATVFRLHDEPFVAPSGGRMDEIISAVRACPSGALSYAIDGEEARDQVDQPRPPAIEVSKDGPYRITGGISLLIDDRERNEGASLEHYSLCRCGHSQNKPFCSGKHWAVSFSDPPASSEPSVFEWAGGFPALLRMTKVFYGKYVPEDPLLSPLFANMSPDHPERVAAWLGETFGGPRAYTDSYGGYDRMVSQHMGKGLTEQQRARWAQLLCRSADDAGLPTDPEFRAAFVSYVEWGSRIAVENSQPGAHPPQHMPVPRWWWVCNATPGSRMSALADPEPEAISLPGPDETIGFVEHIQRLFRPMDRQSMTFAFDLWSYDDVRQHAEAILDRLQKGTMPCDGAWPEAKVDVFRRWVTAGKPEQKG